MKICLVLLLCLLTVVAAGANKCRCDYDRRAVVCSQFQLTRFHPSDMSCGNVFTEIDLSQNKLRSFPNDLHQFKIVNISHNVLHLLVAASAQNVEDLDVSVNSLTQLQLGRAFPSLRHLRASENSLGASDEDFLNGHCGLVYLDVSKNSLTSLDAVTECAQLSVFLAAQNEISDLPENFSKLNKLEKLDLSHNMLEYVIGIPNTVKILNLQDNRISRVSVTTFKGFVSLESLDLSFNRIDILEGGAFLSLTSLQSLYLYRNKIKILRVETFQGMNSLKEIWLQFNDITIVADETFSHIPSLEVVDLSYNLLRDLPALRFGRYVRQVILNLNPISKMNMSALMVMFSGTAVERGVSLGIAFLRGDDPEWSKIVREFEWECFPEAVLREVEELLRFVHTGRLLMFKVPRGICPCVRFDKGDLVFHACITDAEELGSVPWLVAAERRASAAGSDVGITRNFDDEL